MNLSIHKSLALFSLIVLVAMPVMVSAVTYGTYITVDNPSYTTTQYFGQSVSIDGNKFVVGAPRNNANAGSAYLYDATTGALLQTFNNPTPVYGDEFGGSVSISGDKVLIGAFQDDTGANDTGSAYLFDATTGALLQTFNNPTPAESDWFGKSVSISGDKVVIGAASNNSVVGVPGSAYLFDATTGALLQTFNNPTPLISDRFGASVSIFGNNVLISAPSGKVVTRPTGSTYRIGTAYLYDATTSALLRTFEADEIPGNSIQTLAVSGDKVVISYIVTLSGNSSYGFGNVRVYDIITGTSIGGFSNPAASFFDGFGTSLSISSDRVLVGASSKNIGAINNAGSAYLYNITTGSLLHTFNNPSPASSEQFGGSVSISSDNKVLIGAPLDHVGSFFAGKVYRYNPILDTDNDGVIDSVDNCPTLANPDQANTDGDNLGNACDPTPNGDTDNDNIDNLTDNCPINANPDQEDSDSDGIGNVCDTTPNGDTDSDGVDDLADNCPADSNANQTDTDSDGQGDICDFTPNGDTDGDGVDEFVDNCPGVANAGQEDNDSDGIGNACDPTPDGDPDPNPTDTDQCKELGWVDFGFRNQGQCVAFVNTGHDSRE